MAVIEYGVFPHDSRPPIRLRKPKQEADEEAEAEVDAALDHAARPSLR